MPSLKLFVIILKFPSLNRRNIKETFCFRNYSFGTLVEEDIDFPDTALDEIQQLLAVLRNINRWA